MQLKVIRTALENLAETENNDRLWHAAGLVNNTLWAIDTAEGSSNETSKTSPRVASADTGNVRRRTRVSKTR